MQAPNTYYRVSTSDRAPLRIGLLLDSRDEIPAFVARIVEDIKASNFAGIELLVVRKTTAVGAAPGEPTRNSKLEGLLYDLYTRLDARMKPADDPLSPVDCKDMLFGIETIETEISREKSTHRFPAEVLDKIRTKELDVLLRFGFGFDNLQGDILKIARHGLWSYHYGDDEFYRGSPSHFWEMYEASPLSGVTLQVFTDKPESGLVLCKSLFATERTISYSRNRYIPYWGSSDLVIRKLNELHRFGWEYLLERAIPSTPYKGKRNIYRTPGNRDMLAWLGPILLKKAISYPVRRETVQHWRIACRMNGKPLHDFDSDSDFSDFRWIDSPAGHFWADPFAFEQEGQCWAFFEDYSYREKRAAIACSQVSAQGEFGPSVVCLSHPTDHYSYPYIFQAESEIFMIPESYDSNSVDLYRCRQFPNQWIREATLLQGKFVDTTIWQHDGLWWFMTTSADPKPGAGSMLLFYSTSLTGSWHFHPSNPISTDIRRNRGAGRVFRSGNRLIRPSQSGAPSYGYSVAFNQITELSPQRYSERSLRNITPEYWKGISGVHTYNFAGNVELIDGRTSMPLKRARFPHS